MPETEASVDAAPAQRRTRYRRQLRSRIILSFVLLGFGLTTLFAWATNEVRSRVENQLVEEMMNRNISNAARQFELDPENPEFPVDQIRAFVYTPDKFESVRINRPEWYELSDGIVGMTGVDEDGEQFAYKLAVRKTPEAWFYLAYDMTQTAKAEEKFNRAIYGSVFLFTLLSLLVGWWAASRVMSPVSELARRLKQSGRSAQPESLASHFPDDEVGQLAELLLSRPDIDDKTRARLHRIQRAEQQCTDLISALLLLSRNERGHGATDVAKVASQLIEVHRTQTAGKALELRLEREHHDLVVDAPEAAVAVALGNLVGNAVKYTTEGEVVVRMLPRAVEVIDSGPGLSAEDAAKLFQRGYRGTHAGHSQGGGIGLSIVRRLCELYGWDVWVKPGAVRGVVATLTFGRSGGPAAKVAGQKG